MFWNRATPFPRPTATSTSSATIRAATSSLSSSSLTPAAPPSPTPPTPRRRRRRRVFQQKVASTLNGHCNQSRHGKLRKLCKLGHRRVHSSHGTGPPKKGKPFFFCYRRSFLTHRAKGKQKITYRIWLRFLSIVDLGDTTTITFRRFLKKTSDEIDSAARKPER